MKRHLLSMFCVCVSVLAALAAERTVHMLPDEHWWGLGNDFGAEMPFTASSRFACDLRVSNYRNQSMSLLISDRGRALWCAEPVSASISEGEIHFISNQGEVVFVERAGANLADAYRYASKTWFPPSGECPELLYFSAPQYNTWIELNYHQNEKDILAYAQSMLDHKLPPGVFMIDDTWQLGYGVWEFDPRRFGDPKGMVAKLHTMGFKVLLWICPYVSMDSPTFRLLEYGHSTETIQPQPRGGFHTAIGSMAAKPVKWWNGVSALLDLSHPNGRAWFASQLDRLQKDYGVDGFKFDGGDTGDYCGLGAADKSLSPVGMATKYGEFAVRYHGSEYRNAFGFGGKPVIMRLNDKEHSWKALGRLVPDMLAAGLVGSPFICPDMIGGGSWKAFLPGASFDSELFIRSAQVHALCPMMQISASPWRVLDAEHQKVFLAAVALRQKFAPKFVELAKQAAKDGEPIMRTLEYNYPNSGYAKVNDEFMMGADILVAPQVKKGATSRSVMIPTGKWRADDGSVVTGPRNVDVSTPLTRIPHFIREPGS